MLLHPGFVLLLQHRLVLLHPVRLENVPVVHYILVVISWILLVRRVEGVFVVGGHVTLLANLNVLEHLPLALSNLLRGKAFHPLKLLFSLAFAFLVSLVLRLIKSLKKLFVEFILIARFPLLIDWLTGSEVDANKFLMLSFQHLVESEVLVV